jgi:DMSO/TMAO reductase YedYZ molybdopterin-dependent catalytic subunit
VERRLELTLAELRARPAEEVLATMECAGNGRARLEPRPFSQPWLLEAVGTARWTGVPLAALLEEAGIGRGALEVVFCGLDRGLEAGVEQAYARSLPLAEALAGESLLAYAVNGQPLPPQHGFPLRLVVPGWYGMASVKWLASLTVVDRPFTGHQQASAYRLRRSEQDPGAPLARMLPRALMVPPGLVEFPTGRRTLRRGPCLLQGRAWSGHGAIVRVEVSVDGCRSWQEAELVRDLPSPYAWCGWRLRWEPQAPGRYELACRAHDAAGNTQPLEPIWNVGGYANNAVQRLAVDVA